MIFTAGPGHGLAVVANTWLEGAAASELPVDVSPDEGGHCSASSPSPAAFQPMPAGYPGSIHEGGEYALFHALARRFRQPAPGSCCVVGDGEAETGLLATSWSLRTDGAVPPILHLNGCKIANLTIPRQSVMANWNRCSWATGYQPLFVEGDDRKPCDS